MHTVKVTLRSVSPFSPSRYHATEKKNKEASDAYEERTWRERCHYDDAGFLFIPPMMFKNAVANAAKFMSKQIPGKGKATYTKHFKAGLMCFAPLKLDVNVSKVDGEWLFVPSDGRSGGGSRVMKCFPKVDEWEGDVEFVVTDDTITKEVFTETIEEAGRYIGIGRFRPQNGGFYGRFEVKKVEWK